MSINTPKTQPNNPVKKTVWFDEIALWPSNSPHQIINLKEIREMYTKSIKKIVPYFSNNEWETEEILNLATNFSFGKATNLLHKADSWGSRYTPNDWRPIFKPKITINPEKFSSKEEFSDVFFHEICHLVYNYLSIKHWILKNNPTTEAFREYLRNQNTSQDHRFKNEFFARVVTADELHTQGLNDNRIREATGTHWINGLSEAYNTSIDCANTFTRIKIRLYNLLLKQYGGDSNKSQNQQLSSKANDLFNKCIWSLFKYIIAPDTSMEEAKKIVNRAYSTIKRSKSWDDFISKFNSK